MSTVTNNITLYRNASNTVVYQGTTMTYEYQLDPEVYKADLRWNFIYKPVGDSYELQYKLYAKLNTGSTYHEEPYFLFKDDSVHITDCSVQSWSSSLVESGGYHGYILDSSWKEILTSTKYNLSAKRTGDTTRQMRCYVDVKVLMNTEVSRMENIWAATIQGRLLTATFYLDKSWTWGGSTHHDTSYVQFSSSGTGVFIANPIYGDGSTRCDTLTSTSFKPHGTYNISLNIDKDGCTTTGGNTISVGVDEYCTYSNCKFTVDPTATYGQGISPGGYIPAATTDKVYHSTWAESAHTTGSSKTTLPTVTASKRGYTFTNWTYNNQNIGGSGAQSSKSFTANDNGGTIVARHTANRYTVKFDMNIGASEKGVVSPQSMNSFTKTFGSDYTLPSTELVWAKGARTFLGWSTDSSATTAMYDAGGVFTDPAIYENGVSTITLYAVWNTVNNTVTVNYSLGDGLHTEDRTYNYTNLPWRLVNPQWEDHAFLGWTKTKPASWDTNHGVYVSSDDVEQGVIYDGNIVMKTEAQYLDESGKWGRTDTYYGLWVASKKYIKLNEGWVAFDTMYVKDETAWHRVNSLYVKTLDGWQQLMEE